MSTVGLLDKNLRSFKPTGKGGGSKKGKPQSRWPLVLVVIADAIVIRAKGSQESSTIDRKRHITSEQFKTAMEYEAPGWELFVAETMPNRVSSRIALLLNRVYKGYYCGTSDRGVNHDPFTRACESREHWRKQVPLNHPLMAVHEAIRRGKRTIDWKKFL